VDDLGDFLIRFHREQDFDRYSFGAVFEAALAAGLPANAEEDSKVKISFGGKPVTGAEFKDKIVLIGSTATGLMDLKPTSLGDIYPGVFVHASLLDDIVNGDVLRPASGAWNAVIAGALGAAMSLAVLWRRLGRVARPAAIFGPPLILIVLAFHLFAARGLVLALGLPLATAAVAYALSYTGAYLVENRRARSITSLFQHYVPATVVRTLVENPRRVNLLGERRLITVFFSDIAGFTEISNRAVFREDPSRLTAHLNDYLTQVTEVLHRHGATLDKYIGDAVVAFFNAPLFQDDHASAACLAALECQEVIGRFNERARATAMPEFRTRIGLCTGPVTVGNVGSRLRYNYTAIGQTVNLGARLEACNKIYGTGILAGETTATLAGDGLVVREVDYVRVPGIVEEAAPLRLFEIVGARGKVDGGVLERRERFLAALALYRRKEFAAARRGFEDLARHGDSVSRVYVGRCEEFERAPPTGELVHEIHSK
jgi:adenylate cyclase